MAIPKLPWYDKLKKYVAPTERVSEYTLILIIVVTVVILIKGDAVTKAGWAVYVISP